MYYESEPGVLEWLERVLTHPHRRVRIDALGLLAVVDCPRRGQWLRRAQLDHDPSVAATAALVEAQVAVLADARFDLFESDLGSDLEPSDLRWEWEYAVVVCHGTTFPGAPVLVWSASEDDALARRLAVMKSYAGKLHEGEQAVAIVVAKRLVTGYTRSPKTAKEARAWHTNGRPRYRAS